MANGFEKPPMPVPEPDNLTPAEKEQTKLSLDDLLKGAKKLREKEEAAKRGEILTEDLASLQESGLTKEGKADTGKIFERVDAAHRIMKTLEARGYEKDILPRYDYDKLYDIALEALAKDKTNKEGSSLGSTDMKTTTGDEPLEIVLDDEMVKAEPVRGRDSRGGNCGRK